MLVRLELHDQVHALANERLRIADRSFGTIPVVEDLEIHTFLFCGAGDALRNIAGKPELGGVRAISHAVPESLQWTDLETVLVSAHARHQAAPVQSIQEPQHCGPGQPGSFGDLADA